MRATPRVDAYATSFVAPYIAFSAEGSAHVGQRCVYAAQCTSGACVAPIDAPSFLYCTLACASSADCPRAMQCAEVEGQKECLYPMPSPGALGASCRSASECVGGLCGRADASSSSVCTLLCFPDDVSPCPRGFTCRPTHDDASINGCFAPATLPGAPSGGCRIDSSSTSSSTDVWSAFLGLVLAAMARRVRGAFGR